MPIDYSQYPENWSTEIRPDILSRANNCCELCNVKNYAIGHRDQKGKFIEWPHPVKSFSLSKQVAKQSGLHLIKIVLTISHTDRDKTNNDYNNLKALCQRCHLLHDIKQHVQNRKYGRYYSDQSQLKITFND